MEKFNSTVIPMICLAITTLAILLPIELPFCSSKSEIPAISVYFYLIAGNYHGKSGITISYQVSTGKV